MRGIFYLLGFVDGWCCLVAGYLCTLCDFVATLKSTGFYKKRVSKEESERRQQEFEHLKKVLMDKLSDIEEKQTMFEEKQAKFNELVNDLRSFLEKR